MTDQELADCIVAIAHFIDTKEGVVKPAVIRRYRALHKLLSRAAQSSSGSYR